MQVNSNYQKIYFELRLFKSLFFLFNIQICQAALVQFSTITKILLISTGSTHAQCERWRNWFSAYSLFTYKWYYRNGKERCKIKGNFSITDWGSKIELKNFSLAVLLHIGQAINQKSKDCVLVNRIVKFL